MEGALEFGSFAADINELILVVVATGGVLAKQVCCHPYPYLSTVGREARRFRASGGASTTLASVLINKRPCH